MDLTDLKLLRILLSLPLGKLSDNERRAFQAMFDDLSNGRIVNLTKKQRSWLLDLYQKHELHRKPLPRLKKIKVKDKMSKSKLDFGPLPLKPPGK